MTATHVSVAAIVVFAGIGALAFVPPFCRDLRRAGGWRNLLAELLETAPPPALPAPVPEPAEAAAPWWLEEDAGLRRTPWPTACEPVRHAATSGEPPWHPAAPAGRDAP